jgi:hypothetical protein
VTAAARLALVEPVEVRREHVDRATYRAWVWRHVPSSRVRSNRLAVFDEFLERWPRLQEWFTAPLAIGCTTGRAASAGSTGTAAPAS